MLTRAQHKSMHMGTRPYMFLAVAVAAIALMCVGFVLMVIGCDQRLGALHAKCIASEDVQGPVDSIITTWAVRNDTCSRCIQPVTVCTIHGRVDACVQTCARSIQTDCYTAVAMVFLPSQRRACYIQAMATGVDSVAVAQESLYRRLPVTVAVVGAHVGVYFDAHKDTDLCSLTAYGRPRAFAVAGVVCAVVGLASLVLPPVVFLVSTDSWSARRTHTSNAVQPAERV